MVECKNRTLLDACRSMIQVAGLPLRFWQEAVATACYLQNRSPHKILGLQTPYSLWFKHKPNLGHLRVFGSIAYSHVPADKRKKLDPHTRKCIFTGYGESSGVKAYKLFDPHTRKFFYSRSVIFDEISVLEQQKQHEVRDFKQNLKINDLITPNVSQIENYGGPITRSFSKQFQNRKHTDVLGENDDVGVTHYLYNNPTYPNKEGFISSCKDHLREKMENENIQEIQYQDFEMKDYSPNSHQNREATKIY